MFTSEAWEYHGEYFGFPYCNVLPKPFQKPHPPLWVACSQLETIEMTGRRGISALGFQFVSAETNWKPSAPMPRRPAISIVSSCEHATQSGGCGFWTGLGITLRQGMEKLLPW